MNKGLLVVSFGTSHEETRKATIEALEHDLSSAFPERKLYRAWTSGFILKKLRGSLTPAIDSVEGAMDRMISEGITDLLVQPTHMMRGAEFEKTEKLILSRRDSFSRILMGKPLLAEREDLRRLATALEEIFSYIPPDDMLALMGHGSGHMVENPYELLNDIFTADSFEHFRVGTVEHAPGFAPILSAARERRPRKIFLAPLLVVAGDHAVNDMAGESEDSWASRLGREGFETVSILRGMGEYAQVRKLYVAHAQWAETMKNE